MLAPLAALLLLLISPALAADCPVPPPGRVESFRPVFQSCLKDGERRLATRAYTMAGTPMLLTVNPETLVTAQVPAACWQCTDTDDDAESATRLVRAARAATDDAFKRGPVSGNAGMVHGAADGVFVTADLCPTDKPLQRDFLELIARQGPATPVALAISGGWLDRHGSDFRWLTAQQASGALAITWVNHSTRHRYVPGLPAAQNFMLMPGTDADAEIFDTEKLLIEHGETPSVFFRFPGLVADRALMDRIARRHLVALGADAWLALSPHPRPGSIVLVHANGNELLGLKLFRRIEAEGRMPRPLRPITEAPQ